MKDDVVVVVVGHPGSKLERGWCRWWPGERGNRGGYVKVVVDVVVIVFAVVVVFVVFVVVIGHAASKSAIGWCR